MAKTPLSVAPLRPPRWAGRTLLGLVLVVALLAGSGSVGPAGGAGAAEPAPDPVIAAAGDIAGTWDEDEATAALLDGTNPDVILALGDMAYPDGTAAEYAAYYEPTWGRHKAKTKPVPGNHDYHTPGAGAYFAYFGEAAGDPAKGYYAFDLGAWRVYALNSNCDDVPCGAGSEQEQWLRAELAANPRVCTLAFIHHSRFSSHQEEGRRDNRRLSALYQAFYEASGDVWLSGHNHFYERFAPLAPNGMVDLERGVRTFVVGTGGTALYELGEPLLGSEALDNQTHGVVKLVLRPDSYEWKFVPVAGKTFTDSGAASCEPVADTVPPTAPTGLKATVTGHDRVHVTWDAADDDVAVTGYELLRDGVQIASVEGTTYLDAAVQPATTYTYAVVARDAAGNRSEPSMGAVVTTPALAPSPTVVTPEADARVEEANPAVNFGHLSLRTDGGLGEAVESYLRFGVSGLSAPVESATLRIFAMTPSVEGPEIYPASGDWTESGVTWETRPARGEEPLDGAVLVPDDGWVEYDVTDAVTGDGTYTFALAQPGHDGVDFRPRESAVRPELVIVTDELLTTTAYVPEADARVELVNPTANFGRSSLRTDGGRDPAVESYLRFTVTGVSGAVESARLRVFAATPSVDGPEVYRANGEWSESDMTWETRPARGEEALDHAVAVPDDGWVEYDVTAAVDGAGTYTFVLAQSGHDGADFRHRESLLAPELIVVARG